MSASATAASVESTVTTRTARRDGASSWRPRPGHVFVSGYAALLVLFGIAPTLYTVYLAVTSNSGRFVGVSNFIRTAEDFRFLPALAHVAVFLVAWLVVLVVFVTLLALVVHRLASHRTRAVLRFVYYIPGALTGAASVLLWLFMLDPAVSPVAFALHLLGDHSFDRSIDSQHLPFVFMVIAFWTGAGGWILVLYGALNTISPEIMEAAKVDGCGPMRTAWSVQLPMIRKWITYMLILALAAGTQLFVEPQLISQASFGIVPNDYSVNQLAYQFAFTQNDFSGAAAISLDLLLFSLLCAAVFVARGRLFDTD